MSAVAPNFGSCWSCVGDIVMPSVLVSGNRAVAEMAARRLSTRRGQLIDDPNFGYDLVAWLNSDITTAQLASIQSNVNAELVKDERVLSASSSVVFTGGVLIVTVLMVTALGPFTLVLSVAEVAVNPVQILSVTP